jgi:purine-binding chemotaxis protein CheW
MESMLSVDGANRAAPAEGGKYLTFRLGDEEYGLPVLKVREIIKVMDITRVPQVPPHVLGVINLRGKVIPVIDLRRKFGLADQEYDERTCIIVADVHLSSTKVMMGVVVDSVSEVLNVAGAEIDPTPGFGGQQTVDYVLGLAKVKGTVKILLDLDRVLGSDGQLQFGAS